MKYNKPKILLVDDLKSNLFALSAMLDDVDAELYQANSGSKALSMALENDFALILLDVQMPEMDGFEVATYLRSNNQTRHVPIIFNTAIHQTSESRHKGYAVGGVDYIEKPIDAKALLTKVNVFLQMFLQKQQISIEKYKTEVTLSSIPDPVMTVKGREITYMNAAAKSVSLNFERPINCTTIDQFFDFSPDNLSKITKLIEMVSKGETIEDTTLELCFDATNSRHNRVYEFRIIPLMSVRNEQEEIILVFHDISNERSLSKELAFQAFHDPLTACFNRRSFEENYKLAVTRNSRSKNELGLMLIDLDNFKKVNDSGGHQAGDRVLRMAVERINDCLREVDILYRLGGDEFCIILENINEITSQEEPALRILSSLSKPYVLDTDEYFVNASIGIASTNFKVGISSVDMLINADLALYTAKQSGVNKFAFFKAEMRDRLTQKNRLDNDLVKAISASEFQLYYQPQLDIKSNKLCGMEALIRWNHPEKGVVQPTEFISVLETTGLIKSVGRWVISEACRQINEWRNQGLDVPCISVNVSPKQFEEKDLTSFIRNELERFSVPAKLLGIEITETLFMQSSLQIENNLHTLQHMGCKISLDDFGTGYSSLSYLLRFPIDIIKIDQSFIKNIKKQAEYKNMVRAIIHMAHGFSDMKVISEGVETSDVLQLLGGLQCDMYQGYLYSKPLPAEQIRHELVSKQSH